MNDAGVSKTEIGVLKTSEEAGRCQDPRNQQVSIAAIEWGFHEGRAWGLKALSDKIGISHLICCRKIPEM